MAFGDSDVSQSSQSAQRAENTAASSYSITEGGGNIGFIQLARGAKADIEADSAGGISNFIPVAIAGVVVVVLGVAAWLVFRKK